MKSFEAFKQFESLQSEASRSYVDPVTEGDATSIIDEEAFNKLVLKLIDHERDEIKRDGPEKGITAEELEKMHDYVSHHGWVEKFTGKGKEALTGGLKKDYEKTKVGQEMNEDGQK